jgi:competence CoiA-like predicted nuclease
MRYAIIKDEKVKAFNNGLGKCPICKSIVKAYCGKLITHHWKHKNNKDCDTWSEGMSQWHIDWQNCFQKDMQEIIIEKNKEIHRADVYNKARKLTIEFQNSKISVEKMKEREFFYNKMVWVINGFKSLKNISINKLDKNLLHNYLDFPINFRNDWNNSHHFYKNDFHYFLKNNYSDLLIALTIKFNDTFLNSAKQIQDELLGITLGELLNNYKKGLYNNVSNEAQDIIDDYLERLNKINQDYIKANNQYKIGEEFYILNWKYRPKNWDYSNKSIFIDIGDDKLYKIYNIDTQENNYIVRKILKLNFINECKKKKIEKPKNLKSEFKILYSSFYFKRQEQSYIDNKNYLKNKKRNEENEVYYIRPC